MLSNKPTVSQWNLIYTTYRRIKLRTLAFFAAIKERSKQLTPVQRILLISVAMIAVIIAWQHVLLAALFVAGTAGAVYVGNKLHSLWNRFFPEQSSAVIRKEIAETNNILKGVELSHVVISAKLSDVTKTQQQTQSQFATLSEKQARDNIRLDGIESRQEDLTIRISKADQGADALAKRMPGDAKTFADAARPQVVRLDAVLERGSASAEERKAQLAANLAAFNFLAPEADSAMSRAHHATPGRPITPEVVEPAQTPVAAF